MKKLEAINLDSAISRWKTFKDNQLTKRMLPNVIYLNEDGWKANIQLRTMIAMINQ